MKTISSAVGRGGPEPELHYKNSQTTLFCLGYFNQNTTDWVVYKQQTFISHILKSGKSKIKAQACLMSGEARFLVHRQPSCPCVLTRQNGQGNSLWDLFLKSTHLIYKGFILMT